MKPGDNDRLLTFNEGLSVKISSEKYSMEQATPDTEPQEDPQVKAVRNLYAELLAGVMNDLKRGKEVDALSPKVREEVLKYQELALDWLHGAHDSTITFDECAFTLNLCKSAIIASLKAQGLIPKKIAPLEDYPNGTIIA